MQSPTPADARAQRERRIVDAFSPHAPIDEIGLFAGRKEQSEAVASAIVTVGRHAILYGERGVGKTSLANVIRDYLKTAVVVSRVNCTGNDTFDSVMRRLLSQQQISFDRQTVGFVAQKEQEVVRLSEAIPPDALTPDAAAELLASFKYVIVLVVDEFDRLSRDRTSDFADFIKALSDRRASATVVLVGVAENIDDLIADHESIERNVSQIPVPRMSDTELRQIVVTGFENAGCVVSQERVNDAIVRSSHGFPHYTHLIAQTAALEALAREGGLDSEIPLEVTLACVEQGMHRAVLDAQQTHRQSFYKATTSTRSDNLIGYVLVACAMANSDDRGYFSSRDVVSALSEILKRKIVQQNVAYHLGKLTSEDRGPLLERIGRERQYRWRFIDPLMKPYVMMRAVTDGLITV